VAFVKPPPRPRPGSEVTAQEGQCDGERDDADQPHNWISGVEPAPVYPYPAPYYGYYDSWPYYWGYPSVSFGFGFGHGYYGGYHGGGYHGGGYHGGGGGGHH
jgi:hypothetical protein